MMLKNIKKYDNGAYCQLDLLIGEWYAEFPHPSRP